MTEWEELPDDAGAPLHIEDPILKVGFTAVYNGLLRHGGIKPGPKLLYIYLHSYTDQGKAWPVLKQMAEELSTSTETVRVWFQELETLRLVSLGDRSDDFAKEIADDE